MNHLIDSITSASTTIQAILFLIVFATLWNIEKLIGLTQDYRKWQHALTNGIFVLTGLPVQFLLASSFVRVLHWTDEHHFGVVNWIPGLTSKFAIFIVSLLLLDFSEYIYHRVMHHLPIFWRLHLVHHSDRIVDVSTVLREHPVETGIRLLSTLFWVFIFGVPLWCVVFRQIIQVFFTIAVHSNFRLSQKADNILSWVFITPNVHHVHHHYQMPYTDTNYGDILSIWDRMFGTFAQLDADKVIFGVDTHFEDAKNASGIFLLRMPFLKLSKKAKKMLLSGFLLLGSLSLISQHIGAAYFSEDKTTRGHYPINDSKILIIKENKKTTAASK
jgi:sterol desaturase/sphingolipid hydroxylase (fatty acid hydroxylase superfamily)